MKHYFHVTASQSVLWIRIRTDPKLLAGSGSGKTNPDPDISESEINLKQNYSKKLIKIKLFLNKMFNLKNVNSFFLEINPLKSLYLVVIRNLTHLQDGNSKVKFVLKIVETIHVGSEIGSRSGILNRYCIPDNFVPTFSDHKGRPRILVDALSQI